MDYDYDPYDISCDRVDDYDPYDISCDRVDDYDPFDISCDNGYEAGASKAIKKKSEKKMSAKKQGASMKKKANGAVTKSDEKDKADGKTPKPKTKHFEKGVRYDWHYIKLFRTDVENFIGQYARPPDMTRAKAVHTAMMDNIESQMKMLQIFSRLEFVGSAYENVRVKGRQKSEDLEFDVMLVLNLHPLLKESIKDVSNYILVKPGDTELKLHADKFVNKEGYLSSARLVEYFYKQMVIFCNTLSLNNVEIRKHGPAIQMDVYDEVEIEAGDEGRNGKNESNVSTARDKFREKFYSVDIVPTLEIDGEYFVAKQLKGSNNLKQELTWRRSFSLDEKNLMRDIDLNNGCRKNVLRALKVIRNNEPSLHQLSSYVLKNIILRLNDNLKESSKGSEDPWSIDKVGVRLMDGIKQLELELANKCIPCYFQRDINLISDLKEIVIRNMQGRFRHMWNSRVQMNKVMKIERKKKSETDENGDVVKASVDSGLLKLKATKSKIESTEKDKLTISQLKNIERRKMHKPVENKSRILPKRKKK